MDLQYTLQTDIFTEHVCEKGEDEFLNPEVASDIDPEKEFYTLKLNDCSTLSTELVEILYEPNLEFRRLMLEHFGWEQFLSEVGAESCAWDDEYGVLYLTNLTDQEGEPVKIVCVTNSTPEPDGTFKDYYLFVPPYMNSARQAVAWTFGLKASEYKPLSQS